MRARDGIFVFSCALNLGGEKLFVSAGVFVGSSPLLGTRAAFAVVHWSIIYCKERIIFLSASDANYDELTARKACCLYLYLPWTLTYVLPINIASYAQKSARREAPF